MADTGGVAAEQLRQYIERIEQLETEKKSLQDDIKEVYNEAKANGFDVKTMRQVVRLRKQDEHERREQNELLALYCRALGMEE